MIDLLRPPLLMMRNLGEVLVLLLLAPVFASSLNPSLNDDVLGLIVFKADIQDPKGKLASWSEDDYTPCNWTGVQCNPRSNRVVDLDLTGFSLSGRLGRGLLQLQFLRKLSLSNNNLTGKVGPYIARIDNLREIDLGENGFSGSLPSDFFDQCGSLRAISLAGNKFSGKIPDSLASCAGLAALNLSTNQFSGSLPSGIWSLSGLRSLDLSNNLVEGNIQKEIEGMNNLRVINLSKNLFSGQVSDGIGSCLLLRSIDLSENLFSGSLPDTFRQLSLCSNLRLQKNSFVSEVPEWIEEMKSLEMLDLSANTFSGQIPNSVGNLHSLKVLNFSRNGFTGRLPESMHNCPSLMVLDFSHNSISGDLSAWILNLGSQNVTLSEIATPVTTFSGNLQVLDLSHNGFSGAITPDIKIFSSLQILNLSRNSLAGHIPEAVGGMKALDTLDLSRNQLNGSIPEEIGGAESLKVLRLEKNYLGGSIPYSIGNCSSLETLILSGNKLTGQIPASMGKLTDLQIVDLSFNNINGTLPKQLANLPNLLVFNISHNNINGELPAGGFFNTISPSSVSGNPSLCGSVVKKSCPAILPKPIVLDPSSSSDSTSIPLHPGLAHKKAILSISALIAIGAAALIVIGVIAITVLNLRVRSSTSQSAAPLTLSARDDFIHSSTTDANSGKLVMFSGKPDFSTGAHALLNKDCELGRGGFGTVYKTLLRDGYAVAIKKLTVSSLVKSQDEFEKEVKKLGKVRHPNLITLQGYYWTPSLQLLISEFVSGGSLYKHLHEGMDGNVLSWDDRFNIILGTAKSLAYLHQVNIIHYNIKSSNVLIDNSSGEPKVADFGLARLLPMLDRYVLSSKIQSALGYMAPEFACKTVKITEKCDVYGFGVLVLEVVAGKRPVEYMEDDVVILCDMVRGALEDGRVEECIDRRLMGNFPSEEAIPVIKLGLICTSQVPSNRPDMAEVVNILELIRCPSESNEESG